MLSLPQKKSRFQKPIETMSRNTFKEYALITDASLGDEKKAGGLGETSFRQKTSAPGFGHQTALKLSEICAL